MSYQFRRGAEEINKPDAASGGSYRPFIPDLFWKDGDSKYLLFLNPIEDIPCVAMQQVWVGGRKRSVIARTDPAIGEKIDSIQKSWGYDPAERHIAIAVELEATFTVVKRGDREIQRPTGFTVKTREFERRIRDDDGELTEERELVTVPEVGLVIQARGNFFRHLAHKDSTIGPVTEIPVLVTRLGGDKDTDYNIEMFEDKPVDLEALGQFGDAINYLTPEEWELLERENPENETLALALGSLLLDKRLAEMADSEYYTEIFDQIEEPNQYSKSAKRDAASANARPAAQGRQRESRPSQRRNGREEAQPTASSESESPPRRQRAAVTRQSDVKDRLDKLRAEAESTKA